MAGVRLRKHIYTLLPSRLDVCECEKPAGNRDIFFYFIYLIKSSVVDPLKNLIELKKMPFLNENFHYTHIFTKLIFLNDLFSGIFIHIFSEFVTVIFFYYLKAVLFFIGTPFKNNIYIFLYNSQNYSLTRLIHLFTKDYIQKNFSRLILNLEFLYLSAILNTKQTLNTTKTLLKTMPM